ncbi:hypothetical protein FACS189499_09860 [Clostridia bacterium]|nr:hypothetical protein FACS189499_09860 [Clostridia bacterium]
MEFPEKLDVLIARSGFSKTDFAAKVGITYRSLANYVSGARSPKVGIMRRIADSLGVSVKFLMDNSETIDLTSQERWERNSPNAAHISEKYLAETRGIFSGKELSELEKQSLFARITEIYIQAKTDII